MDHLITTIIDVTFRDGDLLVVIEQEWGEKLTRSYSQFDLRMQSSIFVTFHVLSAWQMLVTLVRPDEG